MSGHGSAFVSTCWHSRSLQWTKSFPGACSEVRRRKAIDTVSDTTLQLNGLAGDRRIGQSSSLAHASATLPSGSRSPGIVAHPCFFT